MLKFNSEDILILLRRACEGKRFDNLSFRCAMLLSNYGLSEKEHAILHSVGNDCISSIPIESQQSLATIAQNIQYKLLLTSEELYTLEHIPTGDLFRGLTKEQIVEKIYKYDDGYYEINFCEKSANGEFYIWEAYYRKNLRDTFTDEEIITENKNEAEAINRFLTNAFRRKAWNCAKWRVLQY